LLPICLGNAALHDKAVYNKSATSCAMCRLDHSLEWVSVYAVRTLAVSLQTVVGLTYLDFNQIAQTSSSFALWRTIQP